ncbi:phosphotransferase [Microbacterium sp. NPDC055903]
MAGSLQTEATTPDGGFSTGVASQVGFADGTRLFVKAIPTSTEGTYELYTREATILRGLPSRLPAARLLDAFEQEGWFVLVIEHVVGRHPRQDAADADTAHVLDAIHALSLTRASAALPTLSDELSPDSGSWHRLQADGLLGETTPWCRERVDTLKDLAAGVGEAVAGDRLIHGDLRADNILIDTTGHARLLDWPWAARGAGWEDALLYLLDLLVADPDAPVDPLLGHPVFAESTAAQQNALLAAIGGAWFEKCRLPAPTGMTQLRAFQRREALTVVDWLTRRIP